MVGLITVKPNGDHNIVDVAFHDVLKYKKRVPVLTDFYLFSLGALGEKVSVFDPLYGTKY